MKLLRNEKGLTLVEAAISMTIILMVSTAMFAMLGDSIRGWTYGTSKDKVMNDATLAVQKLARDIRGGRSAVVTPDWKLIVTFPLKVTDPVTNETTYDLTGTDPVTRTYYISSGYLWKQVGINTPIKLARNVSYAKDQSGFDIKPFGALNGEVNIFLSSAEKVGTTGPDKYKDEVRFPVSARVTLRNYKP